MIMLILPLQQNWFLPVNVHATRVHLKTVDAQVRPVPQQYIYGLFWNIGLHILWIVYATYSPFLLPKQPSRSASHGGFCMSSLRASKGPACGEKAIPKPITHTLARRPQSHPVPSSDSDTSNGSDSLVRRVAERNAKHHLVQAVEPRLNRGA